MMSMGGLEMVLLLGLFAGGGSLDVVSTLPAKEYLKHRKVELKADALMELAAETPDTGKKKIGQLMALSHLAADVGLLRQSENFAKHKAKLAEIADGKAAADKLGFSAEYARKVLRVLDGAKSPLPEKRSWKETVKFLPKDAALVGVVDFVGPAKKLPGLDSLFSLMPENEQAGFWANVEKLGNVRIDSFAMALTEPGNGKPAQMFLRFTGKADPHGILELMFPNYLEIIGNVDRKTPSGERYRLLRAPGDKGDGPALAIIGDTELLVGGYPFVGGKKNANHEEVLTSIIAQRGNGSPLDGRLGADLARVPDDATGLAVGALMAQMKGAGMPFPDKILVHARRAVGGVDLNATGTMADVDEAKSIVMAVGAGRDLALKELVKLQGMPIPGLPPEININSIIGLLESVQLEAKGMDAQLRVLVPDETLSMLPTAFLIPMRAGRAAPPPVPAPKVEEVEKKK